MLLSEWNVTLQSITEKIRMALAQRGQLDYDWDNTMPPAEAIANRNMGFNEAAVAH